MTHCPPQSLLSPKAGGGLSPSPAQRPVSPLAGGLVETKNRTLLLKQEDFSRKKDEKPKLEETAKRKDETACLPKPKQSGLSCLRPSTLDEDTEVFTRRSG